MRLRANRTKNQETRAETSDYATFQLNQFHNTF
ncbi:hypothetical protein FHW88_000432 [Mucilaginibacter sp. SG538B]|nr:hypothetical protein [Mucilaginibacter sp. SG538B]